MSFDKEKDPRAESAEINAYIDKVTTGMVNIVKSPIKLKTKAGDVYKRAMEDTCEKSEGGLAVSVVPG